MPRSSGRILGTDKEIKAAHSHGYAKTDFRIRGAPGLQLRVTKNGAKSWALTFKSPLTGSWSRIVFGSYPAVGLAEAKDRAQAIAFDVRNGNDPVYDKRRVAALGTFRDLTAEWMSEHAVRNSRGSLRSRSSDEAQRILDRDVLPVLGDMRADLIKRAHVSQVVEAVAKRGAYVAADRVLGLVRSIFNWAISTGRVEETNPTVGLRRRNASRAKERFLTDGEIRIFWNLIEDMAGISAAIRDALRLQLLTGLRINEVTEAAIAEIDFEQKIWTVPALRMKGKREHSLPLSSFAIAILKGIVAREDAHAERRADRYRTENRRSGLLFPTRMRVDPRARPGKPLKWSRRVPGALDPHAASRAICRCREVFQQAGITASFNTHDLRRSLATHAGEMNVSTDIIGRILDHKKQGVTGRHYNHAQNLEAMRDALDAWAEKVQRIIASENEAIAA